MRSRKTATAVPAARSDGLLVEPVGDETVIYDTDSKQAHCLNPLAAFVFGRCDGHATVGEIARTATQRLGEAVSDADVADAVSQLESRGLLQSAIVVRAGDRLVAINGDGVSRREAIRRIGLAGASATVATSLITTIFPPSALAASGIPIGCGGCTQNQDCIKVPKDAAGHCCQANTGKTCGQRCCVNDNNSCHVTSCHCSITTTTDCTNAAAGTTGCPAGETCNCNCTVCVQDTGCGTCPCGTCPSGSQPCCTPTGQAGC